MAARCSFAIASYPTAYVVGRYPRAYVSLDRAGTPTDVSLAFSESALPFAKATVGRRTFRSCQVGSSRNSSLL